MNFLVQTKLFGTRAGRTQCTSPLRKQADKQAVSCCAATRHIYYLFFFSAQFIFQHQLKLIPISESKIPWASAILGIRCILSASLFCKEDHQPSLLTANAESRHHQVIFFQIFLFCEEAKKGNQHYEQ